MESTTQKRRYAIEIAHIDGEEAVGRVRQYLLWTFPDQSPENIDRALARRPLRFATATTRENAARLVRQLEQLGARVALTDLAETGGKMQAPEIPVVPAPPGAATREARERTAAEGGPPAFFWNAWTEVVFSPATFFASLRAPGGTVQALLFGAVIGLLAMILSFPAHMLALFDRGALEKSELLERYVTGLFTQPLLTVISICLTAWLFHFGLRIVAGQRPFEVTLKVVAYTTAAAVFAAIPKAGPLLATFIALVLTLIGLSRAQRISPIRALGAVVLPVFVLGFMVLLAVGSFALGSYFILEALT